MKRFISFLVAVSTLLATLPVTSSAQFVTRKAKDSVVNAQTRTQTWTATPDGVKGFQVTAVKVSGTVSAFSVLETRIDTVTTLWEIVKDSDTVFLTDQASQIHLWPVSPQYGNGYRIRTVSTGTQKFYVYAAYLRRSQ